MVGVLAGPVVVGRAPAQLGCVPLPLGTPSEREGTMPSQPTPARPAPAENDFDALVVGGGLAGLVTAWNLRSRGFRVGVLEAKDRVGGRLLLQTTTGGVTVDGGGSWVGPLHTEVVKLVD